MTSLLLLLLLHLAFVDVKSTIVDGLVVYPIPNTNWWNGYPYKYDVYLQPEGSENEKQRAYAYYSAPSAATSKNTLQSGKTVSWTTFSFDDVKLNLGVRVTVVANTGWKECIITPLALGIDCIPSGDGYSASFVITKAMTKVSVEFDPPAPNDISRATSVVRDALLIFADPLEQSLELAPSDPYYYGPGDQTIGCITVPANQTVYVAGGAYLRGGFKTEYGTDDVTIRGRGVITVEDGAYTGCSDTHSLVFICGGEGVKIEGVTAVATVYGAIGGHIGGNTYFGNCNIDPVPGQGLVVSNVKVMGWQYAADGIFVGRHGKVSDSFIRVNDDATVDYQSHQIWQRNIIWQLDNGWPFLMQWNTWDGYEPVPALNGVTNVVVKDSIVVHVEQLPIGNYNIGCADGTNRYDGNHRSIFGAWQGESNVVQNITFENIVVEGGLWTMPFYLHVGDSPFSQTQCSCCSNGQINNILFKNINFQYWAAQWSNISGNVAKGGLVSNIEFRNISIDGTRMKSSDQMHLVIGAGAHGVRVV